MKTNDLNQDILDNLFRIYVETTGSWDDKYPVLNDVIDSLNKHHYFEKRAGSRWSGDSKFVINAQGVVFEPNTSFKTKKREQKQIDKAVKEFSEKAGRYLDSLE